MAINNYTTTLKEWENIIRVNLKVANPSLLKSGALGILTNYLASIKFDAIQYYSKTFQEMNVGLAQDLNSMLYHASIYGAEIQFAQASVLSGTLIIPEITLSQVNTLVYHIPKYTLFYDVNDIPFTAVADINIEQSRANISATAWDEINGSRKLAVTRAPNPNNPATDVYLIHTADFQQFERKFEIYTVPSEPVVGRTFEFEVGVKQLNEIKSVNAWINKGESISLAELQQADMNDRVVKNKDITSMNIKFYKFESSNTDEDLFLEMYPSSLSFETGDGIHGKLPEYGSQIIVEIQTTRGSSGNVPNSEFLVSAVDVVEKWNNASFKYYTTVINGMSAAGAVGGQNVDSIESMRDDIFTRISVRNSIITENDYETLFEYQGVRPFVDAKFIDAQAFVFLFNVIRDQDVVVPSTASNQKESWLLSKDEFGHGGPFYPTFDYAGEALVSPFYYKTLDNNRVDAYMVDPSMDISLRADIRTPDAITAREYKVNIAITYDFTTEASYLEVISGAQEELEYYFISDLFRVTLTSNNNDHGAPFTYKIGTLFTDDFCVLRDPISDITLHVKDKQGRILASYVSDATYSQLIKKQIFYKYFQEQDLATIQGQSALVPGPDTMAYLDNVNNNAMSTMVDVTAQVNAVNAVSASDTPVDKYILRMPFISEDYFFSRTPQEMFEVFNAYFIMNYTEEFLNYNTLATQSFHNTIDIPAQYYDSLFERNTNEVQDTPIFPIDIEIHANRVAFMTSKFDSETDFDIALRIEIIKFLKKKEGFTIEFFETDLENHLYDTFNPLIKNVAVLSPTLFQVNSSAEVYSNIQKNLGFLDLLNFIPPYFTYDYDNLNLSITW